MHAQCDRQHTHTQAELYRDKLTSMISLTAASKLLSEISEIVHPLVQQHGQSTAGYIDAIEKTL